MFDNHLLFISTLFDSNKKLLSVRETADKNKGWSMLKFWPFYQQTDLYSIPYRQRDRNHLFFARDLTWFFLLVSFTFDIKQNTLDTGSHRHDFYHCQHHYYCWSCIAQGSWITFVSIWVLIKQNFLSILRLLH